MAKFKIGVLHETKVPKDRRAALTPNTAKKFVDKFDNVEVVVQTSDLRAFKNDEYTKNNIPIVEDVSDCDLLMGVKEVNIEKLIPNKTYMFFAHIAKMQEHNKPLIKALIDKKITIIDYEYLTDEFERRIVAFGFWAGIVGAYNGIRAWAKRTGEYELKPAHEYHDKREMFDTISKIRFKKPFRIVITGGGRVASGAEETLEAFGIKQVIPEEYLTEQYDYPVFTRLDPCHYVRHKNGFEFDLHHFFKHPEEYVSTFKVYTKMTDMYIAAHFWNPKSPRFFTAEDTKREDFTIKVVSDISCDVDNGPVGSTIRATTIDEPFYDFNPISGKEEKAFSSENNITVMSVDNLPGELPRDASEDFSSILIEKVLPNFFNDDKKGIIERATILKEGNLTERFAYLKDWIKS